MRSMSKTVGLTVEDLDAFPDDDVRRELLDGELLVSPSPFRRHQELVGRLHGLIWTHLRAHGGGRVFVAPFDVVLSQDTLFEPDLLFVGDDQLQILTERNVQGPPALVIEVLSDPRRDRVRKHAAYARFAVREYWIVDPDSDWVEVYRLLEPSVYAKPEILRPGERLSTPQIPGLSIDLDELFAPD